MKELVHQFNLYYHVARKYDVVTSSDGRTGACMIDMAIGLFHEYHYGSNDALWYAHFV